MINQSTAAKVVIADDEPACIDLAGRVMRRLGCEVFTASTGALALEVIAREAPDVLLDVEMPGVDGFEVCRRRKSAPATRLTPVVLITGLTATEDCVRGIEAGADEFLSKPFHPEELAARVRSLRGDAIPVLAQIVSIVDAYDTMTTTRPYRQAWTPERAFEELRRDVGKNLMDKALIDALVNLGQNGGLASANSVRAAAHVRQ